jgi:SPP1 gp7 family putative phage head morphogenesis protein
MNTKLPSGLTKDERAILLLFLANERAMNKFLKRLLAEQDKARRLIKLEIKKLLNDIAKKEGTELAVHYRDILLPMSRRQINDFNNLVKTLSVEEKGKFPVWLRRQVKKMQKQPTVRNLLLFMASYPIIELGDTFAKMAEEEWDELSEDIADKFLKHMKFDKTVTSIPKVSTTVWNSGRDELSFKDRIERNADRVAIALALLLEQHIVRTGTVEGADKIIDTRLDIQGRDFSRMTQTGSTLASNVGLLRAFEIAGFNAFQHISVLDSRTTELCRSRHLSVFLLSEAVLGVTVPPLHEHCRSTIIPTIIPNGRKAED